MPRSNTALVAATAVLTAVLTTSLPAMARAGYDALNSDKVDGKHAVGAGATQKARRGKLVATSPKTGRLPNNIIAKAPDANRLDGLDSSAFLPRKGKAADADKLDGRDLKRLLPVSKTEDLGYLGEVTAGKVVHKLTLSLPGPGTLVASGSAHLHISRETDKATDGALWFAASPQEGWDPHGGGAMLRFPGDDTTKVWTTVPFLRTFDVASAGEFTVYVRAAAVGGAVIEGGRLHYLFIPA